MTAYEGEMDIRQVSKRQRYYLQVVVTIVAGSDAAHGGKLSDALQAQPSM